MEVQIYTKTNCPFCVDAKKWFNEHIIDYNEHCMDDEEERLAFYQRINNVQEQLGAREKVGSVPQIFVDGERIGGYTDLIRQQERYSRNVVVDCSCSQKLTNHFTIPLR